MIGFLQKEPFFNIRTNSYENLFVFAFVCPLVDIRITYAVAAGQVRILESRNMKLWINHQ